MKSWAEQWGDCLVGEIIKLNKRIENIEIKGLIELVNNMKGEK